MRKNAIQRNVTNEIAISQLIALDTRIVHNSLQDFSVTTQLRCWIASPMIAEIVNYQYTTWFIFVWRLKLNEWINMNRLKSINKMNFTSSNLLGKLLISVFEKSLITKITIQNMHIPKLTRYDNVYPSLAYSSNKFEITFHFLK